MSIAARRFSGIVLVATLVVLAATPTAPAVAEPADDAMRFGMDIGSVDRLTAEGVPPDYAVFWLGPWTLESGWGGPEHDLDKAYAAGVTPVVQVWYWGDGISVECVQHGCDGKTQAGWQALIDGLAQRLDAHLHGAPVVIVLETEFNKHGIETHEPFDAMLAEKARYLKSVYPPARVAIGFGNWGHHHWSNFDEAMDAADLAGIQGMRGSTHHDVEEYLSVADDVLQGARTLHETFGKPVLVTDIALSSYPEPDWLQHQDVALRGFFDRLDAFRAAGVVGMIYRSIGDDPNFDLANYFGVAERHWGLTRADGSWKPAMETWVATVHEQGGASPEPAPEGAHC